MTPSSWPPGLEYLKASRFHCSVTAELRQYISSGTPSVPSKGNTRSNSWVVIHKITSTAHPAFGQYGLFASKKIPPKTCILEYTGEIHCDDRLDSDYDLSLYRTNEGMSVGIDASQAGNEVCIMRQQHLSLLALFNLAKARFINDYRGIRQKPNALFVDERNDRGVLCMTIWSSGKSIKKGEEISVSYGKSWWNARMSESTHS